ncbi:hypothetical protein Tco_0429575 [Tanacetum coccineum]
MVTVPIHQDTSSVPPMTTLVIDLTMSHPVSTTIHAPLPTSTATTTTSLPPPPPQPQQSTTDPIIVCHIGELEQHMADLVQSNLALEERLDKHGSRLYKLENLNIPQQVSKAVDEIVTDVIWTQKSLEHDTLQKSLEHDKLQKSLEHDYSNLFDTLKRKRRESPRTPPGSPHSQPLPLPPPVSASGSLSTSRASRSSQLPLPPPPLSTSTSGSA